MEYAKNKRGGISVSKRYWKRRPRYTSNYADAVFRGLG